MTGTAQRRDPRIVIVGAGMSGIAAAYVLKQAGFNDFTILEKGSDVGGVWHWNRYPGLRCDVPSYGYQFTFAPKPDWSHVWATGDEIQRYHRDLIDELQLNSHLRLGYEVTEVVFADNQWQVRTADGDKIEADFIVAATGVLHHPFIPDIPGLDSFAGPVVHTARWTNIDTRGKRVAFIGAGSTGVQVFQRCSPTRRTPRPNAAVGDVDADAYAAATHRQPDTAQAAEAAQDGPAVTVHRLRLPRRPGDPTHLATPGGAALRVDVLAGPVAVKELRARLTPDYEPFCKRQVLSGDYYRRIAKPNASFVSEPIAEITETGVRTADGIHHDLDAIVLATGFAAHNYMRPMTLRGRDGLSIDDAWAKGPRAWGMTAIPGFPNLFMVLGPNSPTGSISLQHVAELTARYITMWLNRFRDGEITAVEVTDEATNRFADDIADGMVPIVWNTGCNSWYFADDNHIDLWPFDRKRLTRMLTEPKDADYILT